MDEMFDADLVGVLGNRYHDATTERTVSAQPKKTAPAVKPQAKKETALKADCDAVAKKSSTSTSSVKETAKAFNDLVKTIDGADEASWEPVTERSFIQKLESAVKGMIVPIVSYLFFWAWLQSGMMETVPAIICMSVSMLVLGYNVREALK